MSEWMVQLRCTVIKEICCVGCTKEEAKTAPWEHAEGDELEIDQEDWEVVSVKEQS